MKRGKSFDDLFLFIIQNKLVVTASMHAVTTSKQHLCIFRETQKHESHTCPQWRKYQREEGSFIAFGMLGIWSVEKNVF